MSIKPYLGVFLDLVTLSEGCGMCVHDCACPFAVWQIAQWVTTLWRGPHGRVADSREGNSPGNVTSPCDVWAGQEACAVCVVWVPRGPGQRWRGAVFVVTVVIRSVSLHAYAWCVCPGPLTRSV